MAEALLDAGADVNARAHQGEGDTPLHAAADRGHANMVKLLLARGADPRLAAGDGQTALALAERRGAREAAEALRAAMQARREL